jgi:hypothetical protein
MGRFTDRSRQGDGRYTPTPSVGFALHARAATGRVLPIAAVRGSDCVCPLHEAAPGHLRTVACASMRTFERRLSPDSGHSGFDRACRIVGPSRSLPRTAYTTTYCRSS